MVIMYNVLLLIFLNVKNSTIEDLASKIKKNYTKIKIELKEAKEK